MKKNLLFLLLLTPVFSMAETITGTIRERSSNDAIPYATVSLLRTDSTLYNGAISDDNGNFKLQVQRGTYIFQVSFVGYNTTLRTLEVTKDNSDLGSIYLTEETNAISEIEVKANKPIIQRQMDKIVMNVSSSPFAVGSSGEDMLKKAPGVIVDKDGNVTVNGKTVSVYIDGRPSYMSGEQLRGLLQGTDATTIDKIEIITNPSAKYDAAGQGGIINIKLKKNKSAGLNGTLAASYSGMYFKEPDKYYQGDRVSFNLNYRGAKTYTSLALSQMYSSSADFDSSLYQMPFLGDTMRTISSNFVENAFRYYSARLTNDWYITDRHTFGFIVNVPIMKYDDHFNMNEHDHSLVTLGNDTIQDAVSSGVRKTSWPRYSANLNYTFTINDSLNRELTVNVDYSRSGGTMSTSQNNKILINNDAVINRLPDHLGVETTQKVDIISAKADFQTAFWKTGMIECGAKWTMSHTYNAMVEDSVMPSYSSTTNTSYDYTEHIAALYISASKQFGEHWNAKLGLRGELAANNGLYHKETESKTVRQKPYFNLFPSAFIGYNPTDKWALSLNYTRRIYRPGYWALNPFVTYMDAHTYTCGNPELKPVFTNQVAFSVGWSRYVSIEADFSHSAGVLTERPELMDNGDVKYTYVNFGTTMQAGGTVSLTEIPVVPKFSTDENGKRTVDGAWLALTANIGLFDNISKADVTQDANYGTKHTFFSHYQGTLTAYLPKEWQIAVDASGATPFAQDYNRWSGGYDIGVGLKKTWKQHGLTISANVNDLVRSSVYSSQSVGLTNGCYTYAKGISYSQKVKIGVTWRFGQYQQHKYRNVGDYDQEDRLGGGHK